MILAREPTPIYGGFSHKMFTIITTTGKYAVKILNPQWMLSASAEQNIILSEQIVNIVAGYINAVPAKIFNNNSIQKIDGQFFLVFDWLEGNCLELDEITIEHSKIIGSILADIHKIDFSEINIPNEVHASKKLIEWKYYLQQGKNNNAIWVDLLEENINILNAYYTKSLETSYLLEDRKVISHKNLDSRNVLWNNYTPYIIDWENSGWINPSYDFVNTAIQWSKDWNGNINKDKFIVFANGYKSKNDFPIENWQNVLYKRFIEPLDWLEICLKRSLKIDCNDPEEQQMGTEQVECMIHEVMQFSNKIELLEKWLNEI
jgi:aminoglycoside phosphotransferase (APT) family kinase protein